MPRDLFPAQQLIKVGPVHRIGLQQPGGDALQPTLMLPEVCFDLIHDAGRVMDPAFPAQAIRQ